MSLGRRNFGGLVLTVAVSVIGLASYLSYPTPTEHPQKLSSSQQSNRLPDMSLRSKTCQEAFWGMFVADALSMPVHWYYNTDDIQRDFDGWLTGYVAPRKRHPSSILTISATGGAGRSTFSEKKKSVIGDVILHNKLKFWTKNDRSIHYHQGMSAGDNTLNLHCAARAAIQASRLDSEPASEEDVLAAVMTDYVQFMTTPGTHNDTYAESWHREFFREWDVKGRPAKTEMVMKFIEERQAVLETSHLDHNIDSVGALVQPIPIVLHYADKSEDTAARQAVKLVRMTHGSVNLDPFVDVYARTLHAVLNGASLREKAEEALKTPPVGNARTWRMVQEFSRRATQYSKGSERRLEVYQSAVGQMGLACYIQGAMTSLFFLAHEFHDDFEGGVLTNTNCGGENCHRGAALGALLGAEAARTDKRIPDRFKTGLHSLQNDIQRALDK
ncbi:uncharacterized protein [Diadema antillarum]|uniref:uncharacterized protein n=1 Tax=Diadema antillarum TaxID=105358 RepID=UPI003A851EE9